MIKIENLCFSYGNNEIFRNFNASFEKGELCCVVGPNGCGKSTLLRIISASLKAQRGAVSVDGRDIKEFSRKEYSKNVAFLPQIREPAEITVGDLVALGRFPYTGFSGVMSKEDRQAVDNALSVLNIKHLSDRNVSNLSGGERQRAYLAMVLAQNTPYFLLDEPTTFLDIKHAYDIMETVSQTKRNGVGVVVVSHDLSLALKYADRLLVIDKKDFYSESVTPYDAVKNGILERIFNVGFEINENEGKISYHIFRK